jgi:hypothetical protein
MNDAHVGENAALYALGALDDAERARVDAHARHCPSCARLLGEAESEVAAIVAAEGHIEAPPDLQARIERSLRGVTALAPRRERALWPLAMAAALLVGFLPSMVFWQQERAMRETVALQNAAIGRVTAGDHRTAAFRSSDAREIASVAYGADGSWYVVVVPNASKAMHVVWMHGGEQTLLGSAVPHGDVATLYLPKSHRMDTLALMDGSRVVAEAQLTYD